MPKIPEMGKEQSELVQAEIEKILRKETISQIDHAQGEFLSSLFLVEKKDRGQHPRINLKNLNFFVY